MTTYVGNEVFDIVAERGWRRGLGNLWQGEFSSWFKSSRWLKHLALWVVLVNGMMVIMGFASQEEGGHSRMGAIQTCHAHSVRCIQTDRKLAWNFGHFNTYSRCACIHYRWGSN